MSAELATYLLALALIFGTNLLPAFGPPTAALLVFFAINSDAPKLPLVLGGAVMAAGGRLILAHASRRLRHRFSAERIANLAAAQEMLTRNRARTLSGLGLFVLSPLPSAQLFVAAGLLTVPLVPLTAAFFAGRVVSYALYVGGATLAAASLRDVFALSFSSPTGIALQLVLVVALVALVRVDWAGRLVGRGRGDGGAGERPADGPPPRACAAAATRAISRPARPASGARSRAS